MKFDELHISDHGERTPLSRPEKLEEPPPDLHMRA